jgi:WD40 repeat protein
VEEDEEDEENEENEEAFAHTLMMAGSATLHASLQNATPQRLPAQDPLPDDRSKKVNPSSSQDSQRMFAHLISFDTCHTAMPTGVSANPSGKLIATCSGDDVCIWNHKGKLLHTLSRPGGAFRALMFSPDGRILGAVGDDCLVHLWLLPDRGDPPPHKIRHAQLPPNDEITGHEIGLRCLDFRSDGKYLITGSADESARIWQIDSGRCLRVLPHGNGAVLGVSFGSKKLHTVGEDGGICVWHDDGRMVDRLDGYDTLVSVDASDQAVAWAAENGDVFRMDASGLAPLLRHRGPARVARAFDPDWIFSAGDDGRIFVYVGANPVHSIEVGSSVRGLDFKKGLLAAVCADGSLHLYRN